MPARVEAIFAINDLVLQKIHEVAFITEYKAVAGGLLHDPSRLIQVTLPDDASSQRIIPLHNIISLAHLVLNKKDNKYFINSHVDLTVYNTIY
jgi:hypothetical protein